ncbi:ATP-binding protein [Natrinema salaciae]|uniref:histidine kinase n=1 Tax=Natrinema salaciae TaxID=1186196 RepID=A0A1H9K1U2_9EURY|nr:ATP-binding protein [Natrinema salaciae]SEQ93060.1 His Kinase A (phospho-acceptor) domain-containing protein [Natrinema salaciae]
MGSGKRAFATIGPRRFTGGLGVLYIAFAAVRAVVRFTSGTPIGNVLIVTLLIAAPGFVLASGSRWLSKADIHPEFFPDIAAWCLAGFAAMVGILLLYHVQPDGGISSPATAPPILTALGSLAGFAVGMYDGRAKTHARQLERRNRELQQTQEELEATVDRLENTERRYRILTENLPNGAVALLDDELRHTLVAGQGFEQFDFTAGELRGERIQDTYSQELLDAVEPHYRATLDGESTVFDVAVQDRIFEFRTHPLTGDADDVYAMLVMSQDITDRKVRERDLAKQARQQRTVADLGQLALETDELDELMYDAARQVADVLDTDYCKVLDLDAEREELLLRQGVGWKPGIAGEATVSAHESDSQAAYTLSNNHPIVVEDFETETRFSGPELLRSHDVRSGISTIIGPFDEPWGILGTHDTAPRTFTEEDISFVQSVANIVAEAIERHQYQHELEQLVANLERSNAQLAESNKRLEQFAYAASHDMQEPLRMVSSYLQLIERRYASEFDEDGREFLGFAIDGANRMRSMIDGLLEYSRVETQGEPLGPVDLERVLEDAQKDLHGTIEGHDATITADPLPRVDGDENQLRQVFRNLLENAIEYSGDEPPAVHVSATRDGSRWIVSVEDEGIGIEPDYHDRVFEVFERVHGRADGAGTGIGLALCERIVERHGGDIWVDSEPGEGTAVSFTLSAVSDQDESPVRARSS